MCRVGGKRPVIPLAGVCSSDRIDKEVASRHIVIANAEYRVECVLYIPVRSPSFSGPAHVHTYILRVYEACNHTSMACFTRLDEAGAGGGDTSRLSRFNLQEGCGYSTMCISQMHRYWWRIFRNVGCAICFFLQVEAEENIPVSFDIHQLLSLDEVARRPFLDNLLKGCPANEEVPAFVEKYVGHIKGLNPYL